MPTNFASIKSDIEAALQSNLSAPDTATAKDNLGNAIAQVIVDAAAQAFANAQFTVTFDLDSPIMPGDKVTGTITISSASTDIST